MTHEPTTPRATCRLQLHAGFDFDAAGAIVDYLADLGVSHVYTAPVLAAAPGSTHGYDVVDHERVNPELGGEAGMAAFCGALEKHGLGWVLDIVPNHMAADLTANDAFRDVLRHGRESRFAAMFDIDWDAPSPQLNGRVMLPMLGRPLHEVVADGELRLIRENDSWQLTYYEHRIPLSPESAELIDADEAARLNADPAALLTLIDRQHYRPVFWRRACGQINYRRFFTINSLIGLRIEDPDVFERVHALPLRWVEEGRVDGLRIDHPDGLRHPGRYLHQLRRRAPRTWLVIEKILEGDETLPDDWPVDGTTGYDMLNVLGGLFVDPSGEAAMTETYRQFTGLDDDFHTVVLNSKRYVLDTQFGGEIERLLHLLRKTDRLPRIDDDMLREAVIELAARWPVYRVYPDPEKGALTDGQRRIVDAAIQQARGTIDPAPEALWDMLGDVLTLRVDGDAAMDFALRFQQLTSAATAKGIEDTACYRYNRLVSLNEVGGDPGRFGVSPESFHAFCARIRRDWPATMLASSTHDTMHGEDSRLRISMLSQIPQRWAEAVGHWRDLASRHRRSDQAPSANDEYLLYQTLVGTWPIARRRLTEYMVKAAREAKLNTAWMHRDEDYERALTDFTEAVIDDAELIASVEALLKDLLPAARIASLAQTLIKLTAPGVPDIYQGAELWDETLVDPDNRRPIDFDRRRSMLGQLDALSVDDVMSRMDEAMPKLWVTRQALAARRDHPACFGSEAMYEPIEPAAPDAAPDAGRVVAYRRGEAAVVVAPRFTFELETISPRTCVTLPPGRWVDQLGGGTFDAGPVPAHELWRPCPAALLIRQGDERD